MKVTRRAVLVAVVLLAVGAAVGVDTWLVNRKTEGVVGMPQFARVEDSLVGDDDSSGADVSGADGVSRAERAAASRAALIAAHVVAPDEPRVIYIDSLDVSARVLPMGVTADKSIQTPAHPYDAGWYTGSAKPGASGVMFIDGHASGATRQGLFAYIDTLSRGDAIRVERGDKRVLRYAVTSVEVVALEKVRMGEVLAGSDTELVLMACTGKWLKDKQTYDKRVIVRAKIS